MRRTRPSVREDLDVSQRINVMFICNEWGSSKGGLSTFNREFSANLAKAASDRIKVHCYVCSSSEEDRVDASKQGVNLITARRLPGCNDPMEWLKMPPPELPTPDVVVGHGRKFGSAAYFIKYMTKCKWIHFVHVFCEDLGKHKSEGSSTRDAIADNEEKNKQELEICEVADLVVAVGSRLQRKYKRSLPDIEVEVITPGIFEDFLTQATPLANVQPAEAEEFSIFMIGRGSFEDFALKGYDIVGKAVALLGKKFELKFVGSPQDEQRRIEKWFLEETNIARNQLTICGYCNKKEIKKMFRAADLIVMPSRTEGFGLVALEAISAAVPVLVSSESGIAKALEKVEDGRNVVVNSDKPEDWAGRIQQLSDQKPEDRHASAICLRDKYGEIYTWTKECERFEQMIHGLIQRTDRDVSSNFPLIDQTGNITVKVDTVTSAQDKGLVQTNSERNPLSGDSADAGSGRWKRSPSTSSFTSLKNKFATKKDEPLVPNEEEDTDGSQGAITIIEEPSSQEVKEGSKVELVFNCKARGNSKLSYQWFKDGTELPGKNESTLLLKSVTLADFGWYKCAASCKDSPSDVVDSSPAELDVTPRDGTIYKCLSDIKDPNTQDQIGTLLTLSRHGCGGWRQVAFKYDMDQLSITSLEDNRGAGKRTLEYLQSRHPNLTVYDFCKTLKEHNIKRLDIVKELLGHLSVPSSSNVYV